MRIIATLPLLVALLGLSTLAHASVPTPVNTTFTGGFTVVNSQTADGNTILTIDNTINFLGGIQGTCEDKTETLILHPDGSDNFQATCTFPATILGDSGGITLTFAGNGQGLAFHGSFALNHGTGQLANDNVFGTFEGSFTSATTFAGTVSGQLV